MSPTLQNNITTFPTLDPHVSSSWYRWHQAMELYLSLLGRFEIVNGEITRDEAHMLNGIDLLAFTDPQYIIVLDDNIKEPMPK